MTPRHIYAIALVVAGLAALLWWLAPEHSPRECNTACYSRGFPQAELSDGRCFCLNAYSATEITLGDSE